MGGYIAKKPVHVSRNAAASAVNNESVISGTFCRSLRNSKIRNLTAGVFASLKSLNYL